MAYEASEEEKKIWKAATERRKANGIKLGRFAIMVNRDQLQSIDEYWNSFTVALGREKAADYLIVLMSKGFETLRIAMEKRKNGNREQKG